MILPDVTLNLYFLGKFLQIGIFLQGRARQLYNAGFKNLQQVAHTDATTLIDAIEHMTKKVANAIITAAKVILRVHLEILK